MNVGQDRAPNRFMRKLVREAQAVPAEPSECAKREASVHALTRPSYLVNAQASPGWHVGYCLARNFFHQGKGRVAGTTALFILSCIPCRDGEATDALSGIQAYLQEYVLQNEKFQKEQLVSLHHN